MLNYQPPAFRPPFAPSVSLGQAEKVIAVPPFNLPPVTTGIIFTLGALVSGTVGSYMAMRGSKVIGKKLPTFWQWYTGTGGVGVTLAILGALPPSWSSACFTSPAGSSSRKSSRRWVRRSSRRHSRSEFMAIYGGWENWETWQMAMILDMNEDLEEVITRKIREGDIESFDPARMVTYTAEFLDEYIGEQLPELEFPWNSFFDNAMEKVNWEELAEHHLKDWGFLTRKGRKRQVGPKEWSP